MYGISDRSLTPIIVVVIVKTVNVPNSPGDVGDVLSESLSIRAIAADERTRHTIRSHIAVLRTRISIDFHTSARRIETAVSAPEPMRAHNLGPVSGRTDQSILTTAK